MQRTIVTTYAIELSNIGNILNISAFMICGIPVWLHVTKIIRSRWVLSSSGGLKLSDMIPANKSTTQVADEIIEESFR